MDRSSYFIKDKALFGSFPTQDSVNELENEGVRYFINLTFNDESKITPYTTKYTAISYPIIDRYVPTDWQSYAKFIIKVSYIIRNLKMEDRVYIHCKGGHSRSGVVVASLLCYMFRLNPTESLEQTTKFHSNRSVMRDKWRKLGSPQTYRQKSFIHKFFNILYFCRANRIGNTAGFSSFTSHPVVINGFGSFHTAEAAIQAYKNPSDKEYVNKQEIAKNPHFSALLGNQVNLRADWNKISEEIRYKVTEAKFIQNPQLKDNLIYTGLRPIVHSTNGGVVIDNILMKLREKFILSN